MRPAGPGTSVEIGADPDHCRGAKFDNETITKLKALTKGNEPYVEKAALVGISGLYKVLVTAVMMFSKREFHMFDHKEVALDFLAG